MKRRGYSLAAVCALCAIALFMLTLALDAMLRTAKWGARGEKYEIALRYAHNGFNLALLQLRENPQWAPKSSFSVPTVAGDNSNASASIQFTADDSNQDKSLSLNHFDSEDTVTTATGLTLPPHSVHLVSTGQCRGVRATVEGIVAVAPFPYALASSGPLISTGAFLVGSVEDPASLDDPMALQKALKRGSLLSNASLSLSGSPVRVTGDVVCAGTATLGSGVTVEGSVKERAQPKSMPSFKLADYDTQDKPGVRVLESTHLTKPEAFEGYVRASGDVVVDGELRLSEAIVYIDGSLTINGPLSGRGALFCTGPVRLGSSSIGSLDALAIVSGGDLSITGRGKAISRMVGLLVSMGDLSLADVTVVGAVVCSGDESRALRLANVDVFGSPKGTQFEFNLGWGMKPEYKVLPTLSSPGGLVRLAQLPDSSAPTGMRPAMPADFAGRYDPANPGAPLLRESDFEVVLGNGSVKRLPVPEIVFDSRDVLDGFKNLQDVALNEAKPAATGNSSQGKLSLDLNKFLRVGDTLRIVYRRVY